MTQLTRQQAFDKALFGIRAQNYEQSMNGGVCAYRGRGGNKCAIGHCIDDITAQAWDMSSDATAIQQIADNYPEDFEGYFSFSDVTFLGDLQAVHDQAEMNVSTFEEGMQDLADKYYLDYTDVNAQDTFPPSTILAVPYFQLGGANV